MRLATPGVFAEATFIETRGAVVAIARVDDGKIVQVLKPASTPPFTQVTEAMRAPSGRLLVRLVRNFHRLRLA